MRELAGTAAGAGEPQAKPTQLEALGAIPPLAPVHVPARSQAVDHAVDVNNAVSPLTLLLRNLPRGAGRSWMENLFSNFRGTVDVVKDVDLTYGFAEFWTAADAEAARKHLKLTGWAYPYPKFYKWDPRKTTPKVQFARASSKRPTRGPPSRDHLDPGRGADLPSLLSSDRVSPRPESSRDSVHEAGEVDSGRGVDLRSLLSGDRVLPRRPDSRGSRDSADGAHGVDPGQGVDLRSLLSGDRVSPRRPDSKGSRDSADGARGDRARGGDLGRGAH